MGPIYLGRVSISVPEEGIQYWNGMEFSPTKCSAKLMTNGESRVLISRLKLEWQRQEIAGEMGCPEFEPCGFIEGDEK